MSLFTESEIRNKARKFQRSQYIQESAESIILDSAKSYSVHKTYDIFLSHSIRDAELILGMKIALEELGYSVYIDWVEDPQLDRSTVTKATAEKLRKRMKSSKSLFYITTENSYHSKWMPWECGYFDGVKEKVAITPIVKSSYSNKFVGQEYLGLYPYTVQLPIKNTGKENLWIFRNESEYRHYDHWVEIPNSEIEWMRL